MPGHTLVEVLRRLRPGEDGAHPSDADLVRRYTADRDPDAFEMLVRRHGPMVLGVCRRALRDETDAEDAFQAVFLVFARKASGVRDRAAVGNWLYGVAVNVARRARTATLRRRTHERAAADRPRPPVSELPDRVIDDELNRLPGKYRVPLVLCGLEGKTVRETAADLGWPPGTVATRLARGRDLLARRLARHGIAVPAASVAAVPAVLFARTIQAGGPVPSAVLALTHEVTRAMLVSKLKWPALLLTVCLGLAGAAVVRTPTAVAVPPVPAKSDPQARKLLDRLRELKPKAGEAAEGESAAVLRDFIKLGPTAVPDLIAELDATSDGYMLRCLGFAARAIGDKRAVPALIRALPKCCLPPASDYGLLADDPELLAFLQKHDIDLKRDGPYYSFGRPISEFRSALQTLTGTRHGEDELSSVFLEGTPKQQSLQRGLYRKCAERWAAWWEKHGPGLVGDPKFAKVGLPPADPKAGGPQFPHGPHVISTGARQNWLLESARAARAKTVFLDLDTGRTAGLPDRLKPDAGGPDRLDEIQAWAAAEGFDLMGTEYTPPGGEKPHYVLRGLGLTAWQTDEKRRETLETEVRGGPIELGTPAGGLLARFDAATGKYTAGETGLYLFRTREDGYGWIFVGVEVHDDGQQPGGAAGGDMERNPQGFAKGRRFAYTLVTDGEGK